MLRFWKRSTLLVSAESVCVIFQDSSEDNDSKEERFRTPGLVTAERCLARVKNNLDEQVTLVVGVLAQEPDCSQCFYFASGAKSGVRPAHHADLQ